MINNTKYEDIELDIVLPALIKRGELTIKSIAIFKKDRDFIIKSIESAKPTDYSYGKNYHILVDQFRNIKSTFYKKRPSKLFTIEVSNYLIDEYIKTFKKKIDRIKKMNRINGR